MAYNPKAQVFGGRWQWSLESFCRNAKIPPPFFEECSDIRGARTAWSSRVKIQGRIFGARYWYDGSYVNNAREDAAEVALKVLECEKKVANTIAYTPFQGQLWPWSAT